MNLYHFQKMKRKNNFSISKCFLIIAIFFITHNLFATNKFIDYLSHNGYKCSEVVSYRKLEEYTNNVLIYKNEVLFLKKLDVILGVVFFEGSDHPNFFITDDKFVTLFLTDPMVDDENIFSSLLYNHNSAYHVDFLKRKIYYVDFRFRFASSMPSVRFYSFKRNTYDEFTAIANRKIDYPKFMDTLVSFKYYNPLKGIKLKKIKKVKKSVPVLGMRPNIIKLFSGML
jgi:hypothetical protein